MFSKMVLISRVLLGLIFFVFGLNGLLMFTLGKGFIPAPPPSAEMMTIMTGFMATKYLMISVKIIEIIVGALFLLNIYMSLSLFLILPIMFNIVGIHLFVERSGLPMTIVLVLLIGVLVKSKWSELKVLLTK